MTRRPHVRPALLLVPWACLLVPACQQQMASQPSYKPLSGSPFFADGRSARPLVPGTVARGHLRTDAALFAGMRPGARRGNLFAAVIAGERNILEVLLDTGDDAAFVDTFPLPVTAELMRRGRQRYMIYCVVCHDPLGLGRGKIVERGYTPPPSFHIERLRRVPVGHLFDVITNGYGSMPDYNEQIPVADRWAIVAYVRALQFSQHAPRGELPPADRQALAKLERERRANNPGGGQRP